MPRGQGRGGHWRRGMKGYMQSCLLLMLAREQAHGYSLLDGLVEFGFDRGMDPSLIYRALRDMEEVGLVSSEWGEESQGPKRRVYQILPEGKAYLAEWMNDLRATRDRIDRLLTVYAQEMQER